MSLNLHYIACLCPWACLYPKEFYKQLFFVLQQSWATKQSWATGKSLTTLKLFGLCCCQMMVFWIASQSLALQNLSVYFGGIDWGGRKVLYQLLAGCGLSASLREWNGCQALLFQLFCCWLALIHIYFIFIIDCLLCLLHPDGGWFSLTCNFFFSVVSHKNILVAADKCFVY